MGEHVTLAERREALAAARHALAGIGSALWQASGSDLGPVFREIDETARLLEAARVAVLGEAMDRGETTSELGAARTGWVLEWARASLRVGRGSCTGSRRRCVLRRRPSCGRRSSMDGCRCATRR